MTTIDKILAAILGALMLWALIYVGVMTSASGTCYSRGFPAIKVSGTYSVYCVKQVDATDVMEKL